MIFLASDHGGFSVKEFVKKLLDEEKIAYKDMGPKSKSAEDDYPDYILPLAEKVASEGERGIISCRNGQGAAIAANKVAGIRAAVCWNEECARTARNDDNVNILSIPSDYVTELEAEKIITTWLATPFSYEARHARRIAKITEYEIKSNK